MNTIGERFKYLRKKKGVKQDECALNMSISQGSLSDIENNKTKPSVDTVISASQYFNVTTCFILTGEENNENLMNDNLKEYIEVIKEFKEKGYEPKDIKDLIQFIEKIILKK